MMKNLLKGLALSCLLITGAIAAPINQGPIYIYQPLGSGGGGGGITTLTGDVTAGPGSGSQIATVANLSHVINASLPNSGLVNASTTVAGQSCTLGSTCSIASTNLSDTASIARSSNNLGFFSATTSAQLAGVVSDETGTGALVFGTAPTITLAYGTGLPVSTGISGLGTGVATLLGGASSGTGGPAGTTSPTFATPTLGAATATSINKVTITPPASSATLTIANGKTLTANNTLAFSGTDSSTLNIGAGGTLGTAAFVATGSSGGTIPLLNASANFSGLWVESSTASPSGSLINGNASIWASSSIGGVYTGQGSTYDASISNLAGDTFIQLAHAGGIVITPKLGTVLQLINLPADTASTDKTLCQKTGDLSVATGTGTLGICLGTSSRRFKTDIKPLTVGLSQIESLRPVSYRLKRPYGNPAKIYYGFIAEEGEKVLPILVGKDKENKPNTFDYLGVIPVLVKALQEQQKEILALKAEQHHVH